MKSGARDSEEARSSRGVTVRRERKGKARVAAKAHEEGYAEPDNVGGKRLQAKEFHHNGHHREMRERGRGPNRNKDRDLPHVMGSPVYRAGARP